MSNYQEVAIVVVEDDDIDAMAIERALKKQKIDNALHRVCDGLEALDLLRGKSAHMIVDKPYIVLLDINMPRMNGIEFLEELRNDDALRNTVVFVLTTSKADQDRLAAYDKNVAGYIIKSDVGSGFTEVMTMLESYWKIVTLPT